MPATEKKARILLVDDDPLNLVILERILKDEFALRKARTAPEALAQIDAHLPDMVILDLMMPGGPDGLEFCRRVRADERHRFRKLLVVSGKARVEERLAAYEAGADDYLVKPFDSHELLARVRILQRFQHMEEANREMDLLNRELGERNAELERFTYTVSHDLKSPLVSIEGFLEYLEADLAASDSERVAEDLGEIRHATGRMQGLLRDLLELSRAGRALAPFRRVSLEEIARSAIQLLQGRARERGVVIEIESPLPEVLGDPTRLHEILQNLLENAIKFLGPRVDPKIELGSRPSSSPGQVEIFVRDNGIGVEPRHQEKIFQLFDRLDPAIEGSGVGLTLVKRLVEKHGGALRVESEGQGKGSSFIFTLTPAPGEN